MGIKNRIVSSGLANLDEIMFNPRNWRIHSKEQYEAILTSFHKVGWVQNVVINVTTGNLVDGHLRCIVASKEGETTVPAVYIEVSEEEEMIILMSLDPIAKMASTDKDKLEELFTEIGRDDEKINALIDEIAKSEKISLNKRETDTDAKTEEADRLREKWGTVHGQTWRLGNHLLLCSDCLDEIAVDSLISGEFAQVTITDPPYGMSVGETNMNLKEAYKFGQLANDNLRGDACEEFAYNFGTIAKRNTKRDGSFYFWSAPLYEGTAQLRGLIRAGIHIQSQIIWVKSNFNLGQADYQWKHEICWYGFIKGENHQWHGGRDKVTVWEEKRESTWLHPTQKAVGIITRSIENSTISGDIVFDMFCGSGTTIIACENTGRRCRAIEIAPEFVAVSLERWSEHTGLTPELVGG
jgi:DNA modification methylase